MAKRRITTATELALHFDVHRNTMRKRIAEYNATNTALDMTEFMSVLGFWLWLKKKYGDTVRHKSVHKPREYEQKT